MRNNSIFPFYTLWISNVNWFLGQFIPQFIHVIASNNNLLMDELNVIYFAPKWWLYVMIWLPWTTDNSTNNVKSEEFEVTRVDCIINFGLTHFIL